MNVDVIIVVDVDGDGDLAVGEHEQRLDHRSVRSDLRECTFTSRSFSRIFADQGHVAVAVAVHDHDFDDVYVRLTESDAGWRS